MRRACTFVGILAALVLGCVGGARPIAAQTEAGQTEVTVTGRVVDAATDQGVRNAAVTLEGHGAVLSSFLGAFMFEGVAQGTYTLRVEALGYLELSTELELVRDASLTIQLESDPLLIDEITVAMKTFDFDGRVRDPVLDSNLRDAQVLSDQGHDEQTNTHGRFDLDDVFENVPLRIRIRAFGYLPLDTTFVPTDEGRQSFDLRADPLMERIISVQYEQLEERGGENMYEHVAAINREDMARFMDNGTLQSVMEAKYAHHILRKVGCFVFDEREIQTAQERAILLQVTGAKELQRIELLEFPGGRDRLIMARIYTRRFFKRLVGDGREMTTPYMHANGICR